jgi:hypothetical protein
MAMDMNVLESSLRQRKGLLDRLGDSSRFLMGLFRDGEFSEKAIHKTLEELDVYFCTCCNQVDGITQERRKTYHQLQKLKAELEKADVTERAGILSKIEMFMAKYTRHDNTLRWITDNGKMSQTVSQKLNELLCLRIGFMPRERVEQWTTELAIAIEGQTAIAGAVQDMARTGDLAAVAAAAPATVEGLDTRMPTSTAQHNQTQREANMMEELNRILQ